MLRAIATFVICLILFSGMVLFLFSGEDNRQAKNVPDESRKIVLESATPVRDVTPDDVVQPPLIEALMLERLPAIEPPPLPERPPKPVVWSRPKILSAGLIQSGENRLKLAAIEEIEPEQNCKYADGETWPCGRAAKASLARFVRTRTLSCDPVDQNNGEVVVTRCRIGEQDLSAWLIRYGWAMPKGDAFNREYELARKERRGIWREQKP